jgi:hypothetical protein
MRCPTCTFEKRSHTVTANGAPTTPTGTLPVLEFWDASDAYHVHDATVRMGRFDCSNGHQWWHSHMTRCPQQHCDWNLRPETRAQLTALIPGKSESLADFRTRKISQFLRIQESVIGLRLENSGSYFTWFNAVTRGGASVVFGATVFDYMDHLDLTDVQIMSYFNGGKEPNGETKA